MLLAGLSLSACTLTQTAAPPPTDVAAIVQPTLYAAAQAAEQEHDYLAAANQYRELLKRNPGERALAVKVARMLRYAGLQQDAIDFVHQRLSETGQDQELLVELGKAYLAADRLNLAERYLLEAKAMAPKNWEVHSALGVVYDYRAMHDEARQAYAAALELSPDNPVVLNNLGLSLAQAGDLEAAVETLNKAANQPSATIHVRQNLALLLALKGDLGGAERMARSDLSAEALRKNMSYYKYLAGEASDR